MNHFSSAQEAKDFMVSNIVAEAQRENVPLSEIERKMLCFSETAWTLPDIMQVSDEFDREYDQADYEKKIAHLIRNAANRARKENPEEFATWLSAIRQLQKEDHYITVMVDMAGVSTGRGSGKWKITALAIAAGWLVIASGPIMRQFGLWTPRATNEFGSLTINERLSSFLGYAWLGIIGLFLGGLVYSHFDHERRLYKWFYGSVRSVLRLFGVGARSRRGPKEI
jgi:hypothetical protein